MADNKMVNTSSGFDLKLFISDSDSVRAIYSNMDKMYVYVKDFSASSVEVNFGKIDSTIVKYGEDVVVPLILKGIAKDIFDCGAYVHVEFNVGGTAEVGVDYWMDGVVFDKDDKTYYYKMNAATDTIYIHYLPNTVSAAKKDKTIQLQIKSVKVNGFNKGKVSTSKKVEFTIENVLPRIVGVVPYIENSGESEIAAPANVKLIKMDMDYNTIKVYPDSFTTEYDAYWTGYTSEGRYTGKTTVKNALIESAANVKLYYGYQVTAGTEVSFNIDGGDESFKTAPKIFASAFDPVKDPLENKKAKKITTKAVTRMSPSKNIRSHSPRPQCFITKKYWAADIKAANSLQKSPKTPPPYFKFPVPEWKFS